MMRILKRLLLILATLGLGALAYALLRAEGERVLRPAEGGPREVPPAPPAPPGAPKPAAAEDEPRRCAGVTASGKPCARETQPGSEYCWQHG